MKEIGQDDVELREVRWLLPLGTLPYPLVFDQLRVDNLKWRDWLAMDISADKYGL